MEVCFGAWIRSSMVVIDHYNEETVKDVLDRGFCCIYDYPKTKMGE